MSEKFTPEAISPEQAEEAKFWDEEIAEHLKTASPEVKKLSRDGMIDDVMNNLKMRFKTRNKLDPESFTPEKFVMEQGLAADLNLFIQEHGLQDEYERIEAELARRTALLLEASRKMDIAMMKSMTWEVPESEVRDFFKKAYRELRQRGYTRKEIAG